MSQLHMRFEEQLLSATALVRFCELHKVGDPGIDNVRLCHMALVAGDVSLAITAFRKVPLGGNGCFNDWQPSDTTDFEYELGSFRALVERWARVMQILESAPNNSFKRTAVPKFE